MITTITAPTSSISGGGCKMPDYEVGSHSIHLTNPRVGDEIKTTFCPECEEGVLTVQEQISRYGQEFYLECSDDECGAVFYPVN